MLTRIALVLALILTPTVALADSLGQSPSANSSLTPQVSGGLLGPSSSADSSALQGVASSPLQSSSSSNYGLSAAVGDPLQAGSTSDDLKVLISADSDGAPITPDDGSSVSDLPGLLSAAAVFLGVIGLVIFSRRRERRS